MKIILFGLGSIGRQQANILRDCSGVELFAYRTNKAKAVDGLNIKELYTWEDVEKVKADIAFITNPTFLHIETALRCANLGMHLFIEKPLSSSLEGIDSLRALCSKKRLACYVAYCLRFHPVINKIKELIRDKDIYHVRITCSSFLPDWRKDKNHLESYSVSHEQGGGVLLDLSHEFDYIQYLFGKIKTAKGNSGKVSPVTIDSEDFADVLLTLDNTININLHLNFLSQLKERSIKISFSDGYIVGDLIKNKITFFYQNKREVIEFSLSSDECLKKQAEFFLTNLKTLRGKNNLAESKELLEKILNLRKEKILVFGKNNKL
jgi:predicted dehydrogenase